MLLSNNLLIKAGERRNKSKVSALLDASRFGWKKQQQQKNTDVVFAFDASRLLVKGTWPLVIAKIELDLHLARHKQLCSASTHVLACSRCHFLSSLSSALRLKPLRMTPKIIEKPAQSVTKIQTCFSRKAWEKEEGGCRGEAGKESEEEEGDLSCSLI